MGKRFVEGKGWIVEEDKPGKAGAGPSARLAQPVNQKPAAGLTREDLEKVAGQLGLVVIPASDHRATLERIGELERFLDHANQKLEELQGEGAEVVTPAPAAGKSLSKAELETAIAEAQSLDDLTALMKDVSDKKLLKLADARAEELKGGGK